MRRIIVNHCYTYQVTERKPVQIGDSVIVPSPARFQAQWGKTWTGTVTALNSTFSGPCMVVLDVIPKVK